MKVERWLAIALGSLSMACSMYAKGSAERDELGTIVDRLKEANLPTGTSIRLDYLSDCNAKDERAVPSLKLRTPARGLGGVAAIREIFRGNKNVVITEEPGNLFRIKIGRVSEDLLNTRVSSLELNEVERYNPRMMVTKLLYETKEVPAAATRLGYRLPVRVGGTMVDPAPDLAHLPAAIRNLTVDQILSLVAKTWAKSAEHPNHPTRSVSVVVFGECYARNTKAAKSFDVAVAADLLP